MCVGDAAREEVARLGAEGGAGREEERDRG